MATIAQVAAQRRRQVSQVKAVYSRADTAGERFERKLKTYRSKKKLIESKDMQPLINLYKDYIRNVQMIDKELTNLVNLTNA